MATLLLVWPLRTSEYSVLGVSVPVNGTSLSQWPKLCLLSWLHSNPHFCFLHAWVCLVCAEDTCNEAEKNQLSQGDVAWTGQWPWSGRCQPRNRTQVVILINPATGINRQLPTPLNFTLAKSQGFFEGTGVVGRSMSLGVRTMNLRSQSATLQTILFGSLAPLNWYHFHRGGIIAVPCWRLASLKLGAVLLLNLTI